MKMKKKVVMALGMTLIVLVIGMGVLANIEQAPVTMGDPKGQLVNVEKAIKNRYSN